MRAGSSLLRKVFICSGIEFAHPTGNFGARSRKRLRRHRPFGQHFTGLVNPGAHQGTVGEEEFLRVVIGIAESELAAFCAQFG
jgi:hypothetical protein